MRPLDLDHLQGGASRPARTGRSPFSVRSRKAFFIDPIDLVLLRSHHADAGVDRGVVFEGPPQLAPGHPDSFAAVVHLGVEEQREAGILALGPKLLLDAQDEKPPTL